MDENQFLNDDNGLNISIKKFHISNYIHISIQTILMAVFFYFYCNRDIDQEIKSSIKIILPEEYKANKDVLSILIFCSKL